MRVPSRFRIAASAVTLAGCDLPAMLPRACAVPDYHVLTSVLDDCQDAHRAACKAWLECATPEATHHGADSNGAVAERSRTSANAGREGELVRIARWAIKRVVRAAGEFVSTSAQAHSRDLYWCCTLAECHLADALQAVQAQQHPQMMQHVRAQLARAVQSTHWHGAAGSKVGTLIAQGAEHSAVATSASNGWQSIAAAFAQELWRLLDVYVNAQQLPGSVCLEAVRRSHSMASALDTAALALLTAVPQQWAPPILAATMPKWQPSAPNLQQHSPFRLRLPKPVRRGHAWLQGRAWQALASLVPLTLPAAADLSEGMVVATPPLHSIPLTWRPTEFDCRSSNGRRLAQAHLQALHHELPDSSAAAARSGVVLLRGLAHKWPACRQWSVQHLVRHAGSLQGSVRIAPTASFPFVQPHIGDALAEVCGEQAVPSTERQVLSKTAASLAFAFAFVPVHLALCHVDSTLCPWHAEHDLQHTMYAQGSALGAMYCPWCAA